MKYYSKLELLLITIPASLGLMVTFTEQWIFSPFWSLMLLLIILFGDWCLGLSVSIRRGGTFESKKAWDWIKRTIFTVFLLGICFNAAKLNTAFGFQDNRLITVLSTIPTGFYLWTMSVNLISIIKNAVVMGWMEGRVAKWLYKNLDQSKNDPSDRLHP